VEALAQPGGGGYDAVLALHVIAALVGLGAVAATGSYAALALREGHEPGPAVRRYFGPGVNWPARALYAVPLLGLALVGMAGGRFGFGQAWLWISLVLWGGALAVAESCLWPGEARIQRLLADGQSGGRAAPYAPGGGRSAYRSACLRVVWSSAAVCAVLAAAFGLMVSRPGGPA
jgi:uncharacterized membrane protein